VLEGRAPSSRCKAEDDMLLVTSGASEIEIRRLQSFSNVSIEIVLRTPDEKVSWSVHLRNDLRTTRGRREFDC